MASALYDEPVIQDPQSTDEAASFKPLPPFTLPPVADGEVATPRILGIMPTLRGKRNPVQSILVGGQEFAQYKMPTAYTDPNVDQRFVRPRLPIVKLTDRQVEALRERAKITPWGDTFSGPWSDETVLKGRHDGFASEFVFISDYTAGQDPFASARVALEKVEAANAKLAEKPITAADEMQAIGISQALSNEEPQRGEDLADAANGKRKAGK